MNCNFANKNVPGLLFVAMEAWKALLPSSPAMSLNKFSAITAFGLAMQSVTASLLLTAAPLLSSLSSSNWHEPGLRHYGNAGFRLRYWVWLQHGTTLRCAGNPCEHIWLHMVTADLDNVFMKHDQWCNMLHNPADSKSFTILAVL